MSNPAMAPTDAPQPGEPADRATRILLCEHRNFGSVLSALLRLVEDAVDCRTRPDFELLASMLYYIQVFPERLHHPKESRFLFHALRLRHPGAYALLERLEDEHGQMDQMLLALHRCFIAFQAGAPAGGEHLRDALIAYTHFHFNHMRTEEDQLLPLARRYLLQEDWVNLAQAFESHSDPVFGAAVQRQFERMRRAIEAQAPSKMRLLLRRYGAQEESNPA
jgi:hemerythrin-like domain-containing protein